MAISHKIKINILADYIGNKIYEKIINRETEDFLRENELINYFSNSIMHDFIPTQQEINEAIYSINSKFFFFEAPLIDYNFVDINESLYKNNKERAFFFNYGSNRVELGKILSGILYGDKYLRKNIERKSEKQTMCIIKTSQKMDTFLFNTIKVDCTPSLPNGRKTFIDASNQIYVFNSMFSDYQPNEEIYLDLNDFDYFDKNGSEIYFSKSEIQDIDLDILRSYNFE